MVKVQLLLFSSMLTVVLLASLLVQCRAIDPIPKPFYTFSGSNVYSISENINVHNTYPRCNILNEAVKRFTKYLFNSAYDSYKGSTAGVIRDVTITITSNCFDNSTSKLWPSENMNESYQLKVDNTEISVMSVEVWGALRALQTLFQLVYRTETGNLCINQTVIYDKPRFSYRGFMLDTSRHFIPMQKIFDTLEIMAISKLNVFHWHIVDDQSFPYQSYVYPALSSKGSYHRYTRVYTQNDVATVIEYARLRGIRVIPEFDSPGHSQSWGKGQPNLLTPCYSGSKPNGYYGPINPILNSTFDFLTDLFREILNVFPDNYIHLGGDEVDFNCWKSNPYVVNFTKKHGFPNDFAKLQSYYMIKLIDMIKDLEKRKKMLVWQEVFDNKNEVSKDTTIIHIWKGEDKWQSEMAEVTANNYQAVLSSCWYLNYIHYGVDWKSYYSCDPQSFTGGNPKLVIGGEACMWAEYVDSTNLISRTWPRASVVAERLWSNANVTDVNDMASRLSQFTCRLVINGFPAEASNGPGTYCNQPGKI